MYEKRVPHMLLKKWKTCKEEIKLNYAGLNPNADVPSDQIL